MSLLQSLPFALGSSPGGSDLLAMTGVHWDCAIGGIPFMFNTVDGGPLERSTQEYVRDQFDNSNEPGEQSLTGWWLRSQRRLNGGAGTTYYEPLLGDGSEERFDDSVGVDVFSVPGEAFLCKSMTSVSLSGVGTPKALARQDDSLDVLGSTNYGSLTSSGLATGGAAESGAEYMATSPNGEIWTGATNAIYKDGVSTYTYTGPAAKVWYAKNRLFASFARELYELNPATSGPLATETPLSIPQSWPAETTWEWVGMAETPGAVWAAGTDGHNQGRVFVITLDDTDATVVLERIVLPKGESILSIFGYLDFLVLGTTEGFRVCPTQGDSVSLGPVFGGVPVYAMTAYGSSVYGATWATHDGNTGVVRADLSNEILDGVYAYAKDTYATTSTKPLALEFLPGSTRLVLLTTDSLFLQSTDTYVASGWLKTGLVRWGTLEKKWFAEVEVVGDFSSGSITVATTDEERVFTQETVANTTRKAIAIGTPATPVRAAGVMFTFTPEGTATPVLREYQIRGLPAPRRRRVIQLPLLIADRVVDRYGQGFGRENYGYAQQLGLEILEEAGAPVYFQDFRTGESRRVMVERLRNVQPIAPDGKNGNVEGLTIATLVSVDALSLEPADYASAG